MNNEELNAVQHNSVQYQKTKSEDKDRLYPRKFLFFILRF